ncbi:MAG TPA: alpha/beta hydrolase [Stellaceae bacterium]|nr:alpha/beta hydrolase [Stellaceae bacterium]
MAMKARNLPVLGPQGFLNLAYGEWQGPPGAPTVLCVHGLTRNSRDFDFLAEALSARFRVICPDMPGRGRSDWLDDSADYSFPFYLAVIGALFARLDVASLSWVGTSMGGLIGMLVACLPQAPIDRLVLNDIGPVVAREGLQRIGDVVGRDPAFSNRQEMEVHLREVCAPFGRLTDAQWSHLAEHAGRTRSDGRLGLAYDPKIGDAFRASTPGAALQDLDFWEFYDRIRCPTLVLRGAQSDVLRATDAAVMSGRGPYAQIVEFQGVGHAPALMADDQIAAIRDFLAG